jgi:hypothetical protein
MLDLFFAPVEAPPSPEAAARRRDRLALILGLCLLLFNLLWGLSALGLAVLSATLPRAGHRASAEVVPPNPFSGWEWTLSWAFALGSVLLAGAYAVAAGSLGSRYPFWRRHLGRALLGIALFHLLGLAAALALMAQGM